MALAESLNRMDAEASVSAPSPDIVYRCKICGIESSETTCFAGIATEGPYRLSGTCITCNQPYKPTGIWRRVAGLIVLVFLPTVYLVMVRGTERLGLIGLLILATLFHCLIIILHEMGHALTAKVFGLEVNLLALGVGRLLWRGTVLNVPIRLYAWPLLGLTQLGGQPEHFLRTRVWLTVLMGPVTNLGLIAAAIILWNPLTSWIDSNVVLLWITLNTITVLLNVLPRRFRQSGQTYETDGMQLARLPFKTSAELAQNLALGPAMNAFVTYKDGDYLGAKKICVSELERLPENPPLLILLSASHISLGDYEAARQTVEPLLDPTAKISPQLYAAAQNNLAVALWLRDFNTVRSEESLPRADALAAQAYRHYPCVRAHRSTRALLLASTHRSEDALALLEYINYERGSPEDRGAREIARAFALRQLNRHEEAQLALNLALKLDGKRLPWLTTIGLLPAANEVGEIKEA
jgi:tetratricopeptide (TPR) repeat protein